MTLPSSSDRPAKPPATADVPGFDHDVFISYAHVDNLPRGKGWVDAFHEALEWRVARKIGRLGRIWHIFSLRPEVSLFRILWTRSDLAHESALDEPYQPRAPANNSEAV